MVAKVHRNPMTTKTGKPRLGPLNLNQLKELLEKTSKKKEKSKIERRISTLTKRIEEKNGI